jgi:hypothetical protein
MLGFDTSRRLCTSSKKRFSSFVKAIVSSKRMFSLCLSACLSVCLSVSLSGSKFSWLEHPAEAAVEGAALDCHVVGHL